MTREQHLLQLIKSEYKSLREFSLQVGIANTTLSSMFKKGIGGTAFDTVSTVCRKLNVSVDSLCAHDSIVQISDRTTSAERDMLLQYRRLDYHSKELIRLILDKESSRTEPEICENLRELPVYFLPASAGSGQFLDDSDCENISVSNDVPTSANFGIRIQGDSMSPRIYDGSIAWVQHQPVLQNGEVGIFILNSQAYCKKLEYDSNGYRLHSFNPAYADIVITEFDELRVVGKVVHVSMS